MATLRLVLQRKAVGPEGSTSWAETCSAASGRGTPAGEEEPQDRQGLWEGGKQTSSQVHSGEGTADVQRVQRAGESQKVKEAQDGSSTEFLKDRHLRQD